jgi:hypothetical protein
MKRFSLLKTVSPIKLEAGNGRAGKVASLFVFLPSAKGSGIKSRVVCVFLMAFPVSRGCRTVSCSSALADKKAIVCWITASAASALQDDAAKTIKLPDKNILEI